MSTSGVTTFTITSSQIINYAAKMLGKLADGDTLTTNETTDCMFILNTMVKQWIAKNDYSPGIKMWTRQRGFQFLSAATGIYSMGSIGGTGNSNWTNNFSTTTISGNNAVGATTIHVTTTTATTNNMQPDIGSQTQAIVPNMYVGIQCDDGSLFWTKVSTVPTGATITIASPLLVKSNNLSNVVYFFSTIASPPQAIENIQLRDIQGNDTPVQMLTLDDYMNLPSKQAQNYIGDPIAVYYEPHLVGNSGQGYGLLNTDVAGAQDTSKYFVISYITEIQDFVNSTDEMFFPKEWGMALIYDLARHIAPMFNAQWTPTMENMTMAALRDARNSNNKRTSQGFQPGIRGGELSVQWR